MKCDTTPGQSDIVSMTAQDEHDPESDKKDNDDIHNNTDEENLNKKVERMSHCEVKNTCQNSVETNNYLQLDQSELRVSHDHDSIIEFNCMIY